MSFKSACRTALDFLWPLICSHCREDLKEGELGALCGKCRLKIQSLEPPFCLRCADTISSSRVRCSTCSHSLFSCRLIRSAFLYQGSISSWVQAFKYRGRFPAAEEAGRLMGRFWSRFPELGVPAALVSVPLHLRRENWRGYNQATVIAKALGREIGIPVLEPISRVRATKPQWSLGKSRRAQNILGAFRVTRAGDVFEKNLVLIDDVCTTGASIEACARELMRAGARSVCAYVFAREV